MWDNEARRPGRGTSYAHSSPERYRDWLTAMCRWTEANAGSDRPFVFVNAWNEWAEGAHLEPDRRHGCAYPKRPGDALANFPVRTSGAPIVCVSQTRIFREVCWPEPGADVDAPAALPGRGHFVRSRRTAHDEFEAAAPVHQFWSPELSRDAKLAVIQRLY
jgi:hypothetical protein